MCEARPQARAQAAQPSKGILRVHPVHSLVEKCLKMVVSKVKMLRKEPCELVLLNKKISEFFNTKYSYSKYL